MIFKLKGEQSPKQVLIYKIIPKKMEEEAPEIYISGPLTEAGNVDFEFENKRTQIKHLRTLRRAGQPHTYFTKKLRKHVFLH